MTTQQKISKLSYVNGNNNDYLRIDFEDNPSMYISNGPFNHKNPALCLQAYLEVSPSRLDEAIGKKIPVSDSGVPKIVIQTGKKRLVNSDWFYAQ